MKQLITSLIYSFIAIGLLGNPSVMSELTDGLDIHLGEFAEFNTSIHDNIDDSSTDHAHTHKHGEDEEEHEHEHEHTSSIQSDVKLAQRPLDFYTKIFSQGSLQIMFDRSFVSNPHPMGIFRPPIS